MRYNLKAALITTGVAPPVLAGLWTAFGYFLIYYMLLAAIYVGAVVILLDDRG